jgi:hypothetical protein
VSDNLRHKIKFEIYGNSTTLSMPELAGHRITLSYVPATEDDAAIIEEYGGITNVPAYLVEMKPVLMVEGEPKAIGKPDTLGETQQFVMEFQMPNGERDRVANDVTVGAYYAVGLDLGKVPAMLVEERNTKLKTWVSLINSGLVDPANISIDDTTGELLYITVLAYFGELDTFTRLVASNQNIVWYRQPSEGIVSIGLSVSYLFWSPYKVDATGLNMDVDRNIFMPFSKTGEASMTKSFMIITGMIGSSLESGIFEQLYFTPSVSTITILILAASQDFLIYTINATNIDRILPKLQVSKAVKAAIQNAVAQGREVTIPEREIHYLNWSGTGWIEMDPHSGSAAYMISGGRAGGSTLKKCIFDIFTLLGGSWPYTKGARFSTKALTLVIQIISGDIGSVFGSGSNLPMGALISMTVVMASVTLIMFMATFYLSSTVGIFLVSLILNFFITWIINLGLTNMQSGVWGAMPLRACLKLLGI